MQYFNCSSGALLSLNLNGTEYFYVSNLQGDIIEIVDINGNSLLTYQYDAWGNQERYSDCSEVNLAFKNPYRYRSYRYDNETGYYYLQSRYYDPSIGRFISADNAGYLGAGESLTNYNLYAYFNNNPVMYTDSTGTSIWSDIGNWFSNNWDIVVGVSATIGLAALSIATFGIGTVIVGAVVGAVIGSGFGALNAYINGDNVLFGMLSGMVVGALSGLGGPGIGGMIMAGFTSAFGAATVSLIGDRVNQRQRDFAKAGVSALTAGIFGSLGNGAGNFMASTGKELVIQVVGNSLGSFIFGSYTFISDFLYDKLRRR